MKKFCINCKGYTVGIGQVCPCMINPTEYVYDELRSLVRKDRNKYHDLFMAFQGIFDRSDDINNDLSWLEVNSINSSVVGDADQATVLDLIKYTRECFKVGVK